MVVIYFHYLIKLFFIFILPIKCICSLQMLSFCLWTLDNLYLCKRVVVFNKAHKTTFKGSVKNKFYDSKQFNILSDFFCLVVYHNN
jgi:hypothetical protein